MNSAHVTGGTLGLLLGYTATHFGWNVSQNEALAWGAFIGICFGGLGHMMTGPGIVPAIKRALYGPSGTKK